MKKKKIVILDRSDSVARLTERMLRDWGFDASVETSLFWAQKENQREKISGGNPTDLFVLSFRLIGGNTAVEFVQDLRSQGDRTPVIVASGGFASGRAIEHEFESRDLSGVRGLPKPYKPEEFKVLVESLLGLGDEE